MKLTETDASLIPYQFALMDTWLHISKNVMEAHGVHSLPRAVVIDVVLDVERVERYGGLSPEQLRIWNSQSEETRRALAEVVFWQPVYN